MNISNFINWRIFQFFIRNFSHTYYTCLRLYRMAYSKMYFPFEIRVKFLEHKIMITKSCSKIVLWKYEKMLRYDMNWRSWNKYFSIPKNTWPGSHPVWNDNFTVLNISQKLKISESHWTKQYRLYFNEYKFMINRYLAFSTFLAIQKW